MKKIAIAATVAAAALLAGCSAQAPQDTSAVQTDPQVAQANGNDNQVGAAAQDYSPPAQLPVVSVYVDPPLSQPAPISVEWAPPPMLVDTPSPQPSDDQVWTGGYWVWEGNWVWAHGNWAPPPRPGYHWNNPYYDHRGDSVVFVNGFWAAPGVTFVAPSVNVNIALAIIGIGVIAGMHPHGPDGVFIPAPPGSYYGLIVPAPIGTSPSVVMGSAPLIRDGMRVTINNQRNITNNTTNTTNISNVTNITNVTVMAPASSMANGKAVNASVPALPHLAAAQTAVVNARAPEPSSRQPVAAYVAGHKPMALPPAQAVSADVPAALTQRHASAPQAESARAAAAESHPVPAEARAVAHTEPPMVKEIPPIPARKEAVIEPVEQNRHAAPAPKKPEPKAEVRPEVKPAVRPEAKPEAKPEPEAAAKAAAKPEAKAEPKPENKPEKKPNKPPEKPEHE